LKVLKASEMAAQRASAGGDPRVEQLPGQFDFDATPTLPNFQADFVARRFGLAPGMAEIIASHAFHNGRA
jgi:hypothetical protein